MRDNALTDKLGDLNARFYGCLSNYPAYDTAGNSHRYPEIQLQPVGSLWDVHFLVRKITTVVRTGELGTAKLTIKSQVLFY